MQKINDEESTKVSSIYTEVDRIVFKNQTQRDEVQTLEEQLAEKKKLVSQNKSKLKDLTETQTDLEDKISSQKHRVNKLRIEVESVKRRLDHEESLFNQREQQYQQQQQ